MAANSFGYKQIECQKILYSFIVIADLFFPKIFSLVLLVSSRPFSISKHLSVSCTLSVTADSPNYRKIFKNRVSLDCPMLNELIYFREY